MTQKIEKCIIPVNLELGAKTYHVPIWALLWYITEYVGPLIWALLQFFTETPAQPEITVLKKGCCPQPAQAHLRSQAPQKTDQIITTTISLCVVQAGVELTILLLQSPEVLGLYHHAQLQTLILMA